MEKAEFLNYKSTYIIFKNTLKLLNTKEELASSRKNYIYEVFIPKKFPT